MPSNHALNFFAAATFLGLLARRRSAWATLFTLAAAVGLSRVYLGRHYPSQVLVGAAIGVVAGLLGWLIVARLPFGKRARAHPQR